MVDKNKLLFIGNIKNKNTIIKNLSKNVEIINLDDLNLHTKINNIYSNINKLYFV